jgi:L-alanine-DL-glutamate epimerase-like enolase superfamily enzyme
MAILGVISTGELASDLREAESKKAQGYAAFKIKVGIDKPLIVVRDLSPMPLTISSSSK